MTTSPMALSSDVGGELVSIHLTVNDTPLVWHGEAKTPLLHVLRNELGITSPKDGCSGQAACGACLVEVNGKAVLACSTPMTALDNAQVLTIEGFPLALRRTLAAAFVNRGAVQCGFCTPGFLTRAKILLQTNPCPTRQDVVKAVRPHLCRCTGYQPLVDAILDAAQSLRLQPDTLPPQHPYTGVGASAPKYEAIERALGEKPFVDDLSFPGMLHGALVFSEYPRARILALHLQKARAMPGVVRIITATDIPGRQTTGMFIKDWPVYVEEGRITRFRGDVLACVVAETEAQARTAVAAVEVDYEELPGIFTPEEALEQEAKPDAIFVEPAAGTNILLDKTIKRGPDPEREENFDTDALLKACHYVVHGDFSTPAIEHAFLEAEACVAVPRDMDKTARAESSHFNLDNDVPAELCGENAPQPRPSPVQEPLLRIYDQGQGIWHDREDIAAVLGIPSSALAVTHVDAGGCFGGKEDITVQAHAALAAWIIGLPVKIKLSRPESLRMHPKRHSMRIHCALGCNQHGKLEVAKICVLADAGAYASVSDAVVTRTGIHATGVYHIPYVDVRVQAVYTNNIPAGAFRGFGVNQSNFALESTVDMLCAKAGFDPWQFRYDNAITDSGLLTTDMLTSGQIPGQSVGIRETLLAVKDAYYAHPRAGLACAVKNTGIGNGVPEPCDCLLTVTSAGGLRIDHGWTEMGQGIHTVARQIVCEALTLDTSVPVSVYSLTDSGAFAGSTTASRGTFQLGHALLDASAKLRSALPPLLESPLTSADLIPLAGQVFRGHYDSAGQTSAAGPPGKIRNHVSYSFATHVAFLDKSGHVERILAAHDSGRVINRALYESQVTGGVVMGLGYALSESLDQVKGRLVSEKLRACGLLRSTDMPHIDVIAIEKPDPAGPLGAKGLGEICAIPSTAAVINALARLHGKRCFHLPFQRQPYPTAPPTDTGEVCS